MPISQLSCGVMQSIAQNEVWALPGVACYMSTSVALEGAFASGGPWVAVPGTPGPATALVSVPFIRCPTAVATVIIKRL